MCAEKPEVKITLNVQKMTVKALEERILKGELNMVAPGTHVTIFEINIVVIVLGAFADVEIDDGKGTVIISSDPDDDLSNLAEKSLSEFDIKDGAILKCDDFNQKYELKIILFHA